MINSIINLSFIPILYTTAKLYHCALNNSASCKELYTFCKKNMNLKIRLRFLNFLPRQIFLAKVAIGRSLTIDGLAEAEGFNDGKRTEIKILSNQRR